MKKKSPNLSFLLKTKLLFFLSFYNYTGSSQCMNAISEVNGIQIANGVTVTVTPSGKWGNYILCGNTEAAYIAGFDAHSSYTYGNGRFRFDFSPPIGAAMLNITYLTNTTNGSEVLVITKNDQHYAVTSLGTSTCGPAALITGEGNIMGCNSCSASAAKGVMITGGPISSIVVADSVLNGLAEGVYFSFAFCTMQEVGLMEIDRATATYDLFPNPVQNRAIIKFHAPKEDATFLLYSVTGQQLRKQENVRGEDFIFERGDLPKGLYYFTFQSKENQKIKGKLVVE